MNQTCFVFDLCIASLVSSLFQIQMIHGYKIGGSIRDLPNLELGLDWISFLIGFCWIKMIMFYFKKIKMTLFRYKKNWVLTH